MDNLNCTSLSKGCYVHKPAKLKRKRGPKADIEASTLWEKMDIKIKKIEEMSYTEMFRNILNFTIRCFDPALGDISSIPAAVLVMGVNMSDHSNIFHLLEKHLYCEGIHGTIILDSRKCSTFSTMLQVIVTEYFNKYKQYFNEDDYPKKQECSFQKLYSFHQMILEKNKLKIKSPRKKVHSPHMSAKQIIFLIQDVENFSPTLLQELILNCKIYVEKLPIVLIFGMASAMVTLHSILSQKALCCLEVETFNSIVATEYLTKIIEEVIMSPEEPFKLGPKMFKLIISTVLYHDFSLSNLIYMLKFSMIEHLFNRRTSILCFSESEIPSHINKLTFEELKVLKTLPSLKEYMDNNPNLISSSDNESTFKETIYILIKKFYCNQKLTLILLKLLHCFVKDLPGYPLGKQLRELYSLSLEKEIVSTPAFADAQNLLKMLSQNSILIKLKDALMLLEIENCTENPFILEETKIMLRDYIDKLSKLSVDDFDKKPQDSLFLQNEKITSRYQLQEKIQSSIKLKRSSFEALRNEIMDNLLQKVFRNIQPPSLSPLYEIFYFDDATLIKRSLMAVPRVVSCHALSNPSYYLNCTCCQIKESNDMQTTMPDISILYKLHLESGKLINLYDWLQAFQSIKSSVKILSPKKKTQEKSNDELNIRFLQAVSELQYLGFIKPTKRKTDHVERLTFGSF